MFDSRIKHLIEGVDIDRPRNAITLSHALHNLFGNFNIFFEPVPDAEPHTYRIQSFLPTHFSRTLGLPITRTLHLTPDRTVDPPSPRFLALHRAIAIILHLSAAGDWIDEVLRKAEQMGIQTNGSTEIGRLVSLRLKGLAITS